MSTPAVGAVSRILGLTGRSLNSGAQAVGIGASLVGTIGLANSIKQTSAFTQTGQALSSYLYTPIKTALSSVGQFAAESSVIQSVIGEGSWLGWAGSGIKSFLGTYLTQSIGSLGGFELLTGHLGAIGLAIPIAREAGKMISHRLFRGQVLNTLKMTYPHMAGDVLQQITLQAVKSGKSRQHIAEIAGQLAQAHLKTGSKSTSTLQALGVGTAAVGAAGLNLISSGAQSVTPPTGKLMNGFHV